jgi:uncharacterized membrane protein
MIRKMMRKNNEHAEHKRNYEIQRIETFSDAVFAFAVTLLIVSLEVPKNFQELMINMRGFFAFGISFLILILIWMEQHRFFRNYGMEDAWTITLNVALLFLVLFYVYPLKFLFTLVFSNEIYQGHAVPLRIDDADLPSLMQVYAGGYIAIYALFLFMYIRAFRRAGLLGMNSMEKFDCKTDIYKQLIMAIVGLCSLISTWLLPLRLIAASGYLYMAIGPALTIYFYLRIKIRNRLFLRDK